MILAITNTKDGVGKTTTPSTCPLTSPPGSAEPFWSTDPQAHATACLLDNEPERDVSDLIMERPSQAVRAISSTDIPGLDIVSATARLTETFELLSARIRREERLTRTLEPLADSYRDIILDCPPSLAILAYNAIIAAPDLLLVPVQTGVGAVDRLDALLEAARELRDKDEVPYRILVIMFDFRTSRSNAIIEELLEEHRRHLFKTVIAKSEPLNQANLARTPIAHFAPSSRGAQEYGDLCDEILRLRIRPRAWPDDAAWSETGDLKHQAAVD